MHLEDKFLLAMALVSFLVDLFQDPTFSLIAISGAFVIGYFGRLSGQKNVRSLILAVADIIKIPGYRQIRLLIVGKGGHFIYKLMVFQ